MMLKDAVDGKLRAHKKALAKEQDLALQMEVHQHTTTHYTLNYTSYNIQ